MSSSAGRSGQGLRRLIGGYGRIPIPPDPTIPSIMLRIHNHLPPKPVFPDMKKTDPAGYHGGGIAHEVAALVSLCFGIRLKSEGITRHWTPGADSAGEPICWDVDQVPMLMRPYG